MKKLFFILLAVSFSIFFSAILINPAIIFLAKRQLNTIFKGSEVAIGSCRLNPVKQFSLFEISIKNKQAYSLLVAEARVEYSLFSILKGKIGKFSVKDAKINIDLPQKSITAFSQYLNLGPQGVFRVQSLELSDCKLAVKAKDFNADGFVSSQVNLAEKIMDYLDVKIDSLGIQGLQVSGISFKAAQGSTEGYCGISRIKYDKLAVSGIKSQVMLSGKELFLENVSANAFDGNIGGNLKLKIDQDFSYGAVLKITNFDIARFIDDFDLKEKFEMTGRLSGDLTFNGKGPDIETLDGKLSSLESGGMLIIKDTGVLENMARDTNKSLNLLVENLKDYHYTIGTIKLFLDNSDLIMDTVLDGETGKRTISIVLHDFRLKKEEL